MVNLLPSEYQKSVAKIRRARFVIAASCVAIAVAAVAGLSLVPSYLEIRFGVSVPVNGIVKAPVGYVQDRTQIQEAQTLAQQLAPLVATSTTPMRSLMDALSEKPSGVSVDQITYSAGSQSGELILSGTAVSPDLISAYKTTLSQDPLFSSVSLPLGALVGASAGSFTMTLTGTF